MTQRRHAVQITGALRKANSVLSADAAPKCARPFTFVFRCCSTNVSLLSTARAGCNGHIAAALYQLSDSVTDYLEFERSYEDGELSRADLEAAARARNVYYDDNTSSYRIYEGVLSSMRADLLYIDQVIKDKIKTSNGGGG